MGFRISDLVATVVECCEERCPPGPGHPPAETVRVLATLRRRLARGHAVVQPDGKRGQSQRLDPAPPSGSLGAGWRAGAGDGVPVACVATAANVNDTLAFERLFLAAFAVMARVATVFADKGYDAEHHRELCRAFGAEPHIHKRRQPSGSGLGQRRWPVERSNAWLLENKRLALRCDRLGFIVQSLLQTTCALLVAGRLAREL